LDSRANAIEIASIKSHQLYADGFKQPGKLLQTLTAEINTLAGFTYGERENVVVSRGRNTTMILEIEVPPGSRSTPVRDPKHPTSAEQLRAQWVKEVQEAEALALRVGVQLVIKETTSAR
jgi:hypothetical protein